MLGVQMTGTAMVAYRVAGPADAAAVAALHADSWSRTYRGAYADGFLDGDVVADRYAVWRGRLESSSEREQTMLAEEDGSLVGFVHTILGEDPIWGSLLDNLHVAADHRRRGIGAKLVGASARFVIDRAPGSRLYLWVLEQNRSAQGFYRRLGGRPVERDLVPAPGGVAERLNGSPSCFRYVWDDPSTISAPRSPDPVPGQPRSGPEG